MSSRKNKVLLVFALAIISMNILTLLQVNGIMNNQIDNETTLPSYVEEISNGGNIPFIPNSEGSDYLLKHQNEDSVPDRFPLHWMTVLLHNFSRAAPDNSP